LLAFVAALGYSRASRVRFTRGEDAVTLCGCVREALQIFGGAPRRAVACAKLQIVGRKRIGQGLRAVFQPTLRAAQQHRFMCSTSMRR
jgi:transposase